MFDGLFDSAGRAALLHRQPLGAVTKSVDSSAGGRLPTLAL